MLSCVPAAFLSVPWLSMIGGEALSVPRPELLPRGEALLSDLACLACHDAPEAIHERIRPKTPPRLDAVGARVSPEYLRRFLADPHGTAPGTTMPDVLGGMDPDTVESLVHFLASLGGPLASDSRAFPGDLERGRQLFHEVGCVACHEPLDEAWTLEWPFWEFEDVDEDEEGDADEDDEERYVPPGTLPSPRVPLPDLGAKTTVEALATFLEDPLHVRPSGRMPSLSLSRDDALAIASYLVVNPKSEEVAIETASGLGYEYFESRFHESEPYFKDGVADFDALKAQRRGVVMDLGELPEHRPDQFGFRYRGFIEIKEEGTYTFYTSSDDGSRLRIDGELVVANDGFHGTKEASGEVALSDGSHAIEVTMFEGGGGEALTVSWEGPGIPKAIVPADVLSHGSYAVTRESDASFAVDPDRVALGRATFLAAGCVHCHDDPVGESTPELRSGKPLLALDPSSAAGCLGEAPRDGLPRYAFEDGDREALVATLRRREALATPVSAAERVTRSFARNRCYACHRRDGVGGPHPDRRPYFEIKGDAELGDEGRLPPPLDYVGAKLQPDTLRAVLEDGDTVRPYMATRMPQFGSENVGELAALFEALDAPLDEEAPPFDLEAVEIGRRLVGTGGLGCIQCHTFLGYESLGVPAVDLGTVEERLRPDWFMDLLLDPNALNMNTRMPEFWVDGKSPVADAYGGDPARQIEAMWTYLALGDAMPLPEGLVVADGTYELEAIERPIACGVFMKGVSPRTVAVGTPERVHYAFDVQNSRLAKVWRGRFFNAKGTWHARAGALEEPPGDVLDLPPGSAFARLASSDAPWPEGSGRDVGLRPGGRFYDEEQLPVFHYAFGPVIVFESPAPQLTSGGGEIVRRMVFTTTERVDDLWMRVAVGRSITRQGAVKPSSSTTVSASYRVDDRWTCRVRDSREAPVIRDTGDGQELVVRVDLPHDGPEHAEWLHVEVSW